jgi:hypothetical protein
VVKYNLPSGKDEEWTIIPVRLFSRLLLLLRVAVMDRGKEASDKEGSDAESYDDDDDDVLTCRRCGGCSILRTLPEKNVNKVFNPLYEFQAFITKLTAIFTTCRLSK